MIVLVVRFCCVSHSLVSHRGRRLPAHRAERRRQLDEARREIARLQEMLEKGGNRGFSSNSTVGGDSGGSSNSQVQQGWEGVCSVLRAPDSEFASHGTTCPFAKGATLRAKTWSEPFLA